MENKTRELHSPLAIAGSAFVIGPLASTLMVVLNLYRLEKVRISYWAAGLGLILTLIEALLLTLPSTTSFMGGKYLYFLPLVNAFIYYLVAEILLEKDYIQHIGTGGTKTSVWEVCVTALIGGLASLLVLWMVSHPRVIFNVPQIVRLNRYVDKVAAYCDQIDSVGQNFQELSERTEGSGENYDAQQVDALLAQANKIAGGLQSLKPRNADLQEMQQSVNGMATVFEELMQAMRAVLVENASGDAINEIEGRYKWHVEKMLEKRDELKKKYGL